MSQVLNQAEENGFDDCTHHIQPTCHLLGPKLYGVAWMRLSRTFATHAVSLEWLKFPIYLRQSKELKLVAVLREPPSFQES